MWKTPGFVHFYIMSEGYYPHFYKAQFKILMQTLSLPLSLSPLSIPVCLQQLPARLDQRVQCIYKYMVDATMRLAVFLWRFETLVRCVIIVVVLL